MSIQSEITRIENARDNSFTQVAAKGVTVPSSADIEDLPGLIAAIAQGGGGIALPETITAGDTPILINTKTNTTSGNSTVASGCSLTIPATGTYRFSYVTHRTSTSGSCSSRLYKNGKDTNTGEFLPRDVLFKFYSIDLACQAGDKIELYQRGATSTSCTTGYLTACIAWNNGFTGG